MSFLKLGNTDMDNLFTAGGFWITSISPHPKKDWNLVKLFPGIFLVLYLLC